MYKFSFDQRLNESESIMKKYPKRIPVICERSLQAPENCPDIDKNKYMVPLDLTVGQFIYVIRKRMKLNPQTAIILMINDSIILSSLNVFKHLYTHHKNTDGFLYIKYTLENTFG